MLGFNANCSTGSMRLDYNILIAIGSFIYKISAAHDSRTNENDYLYSVNLSFTALVSEQTILFSALFLYTCFLLKYFFN